MRHAADYTARTRTGRMLPSLLLVSLLLVPALAPHGSRAAGAANPPASASARATGASTLARLPLSFTPNAGQLDASVKYQMRAPGGTVFFKEGEVAYRLPAPRGLTRRKGEPPLLRSLDLRVRFEGASSRPSIEGRGLLPGTANYFVGGDPARWRASLPTYAALVYRRLYAGVDLAYDGAGGRLKSTYTVAPFADPARIRWRYEGATRVRVDGQTGDLRAALPVDAAQLAALTKAKETPSAKAAAASERGVGSEGKSPGAAARADGARADGAKMKATLPEFVERAPVAWQDVGGRRVFVAARYEVAADGSVGFALGRYDRSRPLVIDPDIEWSYYVGGAGNDYGYSVALDAAGNIYVAGVTSSVNFPQSVPPGAQSLFGGKIDVFVVKLNPTGDRILYSTFLGGEDDDCAFGLALDAAGNAHVAGYTRSANFPVTAGAAQTRYGGGPADAFAAKLSADGRTLHYSTFLGGTDEESARSLALAPDGRAFVVGYTRSTDFPATPGALQTSNAGNEDAFALKLAADGRAVAYATYLGGAAADYGEAVVVDGQGAAHLVGSTESSDFPVAHAAQTTKGAADDAFAVKFRPDGGALAYSTFLGGGDSDFARAAALDRRGDLYVAGFTRSADFPAAEAFQAANAGGDDAFVTRLKSNGKLLYSTYLGGAGDDNAFGLAVDRAGYVTLTGRTTSPDFPVANPPAGGARGSDGNDVFVTRLAPGGRALRFSTYVGGNGHEIGEAVALDAAGNAVVTGYTYSDTGFPKPPTDPLRGLLDEEMFVLKITDPTPPPAPCTIGLDPLGCVEP